MYSGGILWNELYHVRCYPAVSPVSLALPCRCQTADDRILHETGPTHISGRVSLDLIWPSSMS